MGDVQATARHKASSHGRRFFGAQPDVSTPFFAGRAQMLRRKCERCEAEDEGQIQTRLGDGSAGVQPGLAVAQPIHAPGAHVLRQPEREERQEDAIQAPQSTVVQRAPLDFRITEVYANAAAHPSRIFFASGSTAIPASEMPKIAPLATPAGRDLTLNGFSSEEGSDSANDTLIAARIAAVDAALVGAGHGAATPRRPVNLRASGEGEISYRRMRSVEVLPTPIPLVGPIVPAPSGQNPCNVPGSEVEPCGTALTGSWPDADAAMTKAVADLVGPTAAATALLTRLFRLVPVADVRTNIGRLATQVRGLDPAAPAASRYRSQCHNNCDAGCGRPAYNTGTGLGPAGALMTLCPGFLNSPSKARQARLLMHESAHGTPGLAADDIAYTSTRQISFLTLADQRRNTDSYVALAWLLFKPGSITVGPSAADTLVGMSGPGPGTEEDKANQAVAWLETWLNYGDFDTEILYDTVNRSVPPAAAWATRSGDVFNRQTMRRLAPIFGLTNPGAAAPFTQPVDRDKTKLAAIHDRYDQMYAAVYARPVTVTKGAPGSDAWGGRGAVLPRLDQTVVVGPAFFAMSPPNRVKHLVLLMAQNMHGISPGFASKYADAIDSIRAHRSLGP